jgi:threonine/homoserine/homoserine lactone efflux protein
MRDMRWLREWAPELLPIVIAIALPLAGVLLAAQAGLTGDRQQGLRIFAACVLGTCVWAIVLTA